MTSGQGARSIVQPSLALTITQWRTVQELVVKEQRTVIDLQTDKADVLRASVNAEHAVERYLSALADLREFLEKEIGPAA